MLKYILLIKQDKQDGVLPPSCSRFPHLLALGKIIRIQFYLKLHIFWFAFLHNIGAEWGRFMFWFLLKLWIFQFSQHLAYCPSRNFSKTTGYNHNSDSECCQYTCRCEYSLHPATFLNHLLPLLPFYMVNMRTIILRITFIYWSDDFVREILVSLLITAELSMNFQCRPL